MANKDLSQNIELNVTLNQQSVQKVRSEMKTIAEEIDLNISSLAQSLKSSGSKVASKQALPKALGLNEGEKVKIGVFADLKKQLKQYADSVSIQGMNQDAFNDLFDPIIEAYDDVRSELTLRIKQDAKLMGVWVEESAEFGIPESVISDLMQEGSKAKQSALDFIENLTETMQKIQSGKALDLKNIQESFDVKLNKNSFIIDPLSASVIMEKLYGALGDSIDMSGNRVSFQGGQIEGGKKGPSDGQPGKDYIPATPEQAKAARDEIFRYVSQGKATAAEAAQALMTATGGLIEQVWEAGIKAFEETLLGFKNIKKLIETDGTFSVDALASEDAVAGGLRYGIESGLEAMTRKEAELGLLPGTAVATKSTAVLPSYGTTIENVPGHEGKILSPSQFASWLNENMPEISDEAGQAVSNLLQVAVADPVLQVLQDPNILGPGFAKGKGRSGTATQLTRLLSNSLGPDASRFIDAEQVGIDQILAKASPNREAFAPGDAYRLGGPGTKLSDVERELELKRDLMEANKRNIEIETDPAVKQERIEKAASYEKQIQHLKSVKQAITGIVEEEKQAPVAAAAKAPLSSGIAPINYEQMKKTLLDSKKEVEAAGKEFAIGFDTEFNKQIPGIITEASLRVRKASGEFYNLFDMFHAPTPSQAGKMASGAFASNPKSIAELKQVAKQADYLEPVGSKDELKNFMQLHGKIQNLTKILSIAAELDIPVVGNSIQGAEWSQSMVPAIAMINNVITGNKDMGEGFKKLHERIVEANISLDTIEVPQPKLRDLGQIVSKAAESEQAKMLSSGNVDGKIGNSSVKLGNLLRNTVEQFGDMIDKETKSSISLAGGEFSIGGKPAHRASADAEASLIVHDAMVNMEQLSGAIENVTKKVNTQAIALTNAGAGSGSGGGSMPPSGGGFAARAESAEPSAARLALRYKELDQLTRSLTEAEAKLVNVSLDRQSKTPRHIEGMRDAIEASRGLISADELLFGAESKLETISLERIRQLASYSSAIDQSSDASVEAKEAITALAKLEEKAVDGEVRRADVVQELRKVQKAYNVSMFESIEVAKKGEIATRDEIKLEQRKGDVKEQNLQTLSKQIDEEIRLKYTTQGAGKAIVRSLKEQLEMEKQVAAANKQLINQWVTGRYALYDVGNAYQNVSRNLFQAARQIFNLTQAYRSYETAFTSVERAMQLDFTDASGQAASLKEEFVKLSEQIPVAFEELSRIATLGAQMGIDAGGIVEFTDTVAKFASITGISADTVAQRFGKIAELANVDSSDFEKLGSAVAYAGINAVATETEILTLSESIAAVSNQAGLTAPEIVGMSTALASVGIPAEQARGVFTRVFADIDRAVATGGKSLDAFAKISGLSGEEFAKSWGTEGASYDVFRSILGGLSSTSSLTKAFDSLNIVETREINTLTRLANNLNVVDQAIGDAGASFGEGEFLADSFEKTVDNLDAQITIFKNNLKSIGEELITGLAPYLKDAIEKASGFANVLKEMAKTPALRALAGASLGLITLGAGFTAITSLVAKTTAQIYAFRVAMLNSVNAGGSVDSISGKIKQLTNVSSGLLEIRDKIQGDPLGLSQRGQIEPVVFGLQDFIKGHEAKKKFLLDERNIYLANGAVIAQAEGRIEKASQLRNLSAAEATNFARREAAEIDKLVQARLLDIDALKQTTDTSTLAGKAKIKEAESAKILYRWVNGEAVAYTQAEVARAQGIVSGQIMATTKQKEAAAHILNSKAIDAETRSATMAEKGIMAGSRIMGFVGTAGILVTAATAIFSIVQGIVTAVNEVNKIDLLESGGGIASLKDAIEQDTKAWRANREEVEASAGFISTAVVKYKEYSKEIDSAAGAIKTLTGANAEVASGIDNTTERIISQTVALGENYRQWLANAIMNNPKLKEWQEEDPLALDSMMAVMAEAGVSFESMIDGFVQKAQGADIDPLKDIDAMVEKARALRNANPIEIGMSTEEYKQASAIQSDLDNLERLQSLLRSIGASITTAFSMTSMWNSIKNALGLVSNGVLDLVDSYAEAVKSGKGMAAVMKQVRVQAILLAENANIQIDFSSANTVEEMIKVAEAAKDAAVALALLKAGEGPQGPHSFADIQAIVEAKYNPVINSLKALTVGAAAATAAVSSTGAAAETAAEKLKRLLAAANAFAGVAMNMNSALRAFGATLKESTSWSIMSDGGAAKISGILAVITQIGEKSKSTPQAIRELQAFQIVLTEMGAPASAIEYVSRAILKLGGDATLTVKEIAALKAQFPSLFKNMQSQIETGAKPFKTLTTYVGELKNAIQAAFDIRYGKEISFDALTKGWMNMKEAASEAGKAVKAANDEINGLTADRSILEYQLSVAERYGDERRAAVIRAKLAKVDGDLASKKEDLTKAQEASSTALTGDTDAAINNRAKIRELVGTYTGYLTSLANAGMSSEDLKKEAARLAGEFLSQGKSLGFAEEELKKYTSAFEGDFTTVINGLPTNITLEVDTDPALRAIKEFVAESNALLTGLNFGSDQEQAPVPTSEELRGYNWAKRVMLNKSLPKKTRDFAAERIRNFKAKYGTGYAMGGLVTGPGTSTSDSIPAMLSKGEFVVKASAVSAYGVDFLNALNQQRVGFNPVQPSAPVQQSSGPQMVYLSPEDRALLRQAVDRPVNLYTENQKIASSANAGNVILAQRGAR